MQIDFSLFLTGISLLITLYIFHFTLRRELYKSRYEHLLFPIYDFLEPYLYKDVCTVPLDKLFSLFKSQKSLSTVRLIEQMYHLEANPNQENYNNLCRLVIWEYTSLSIPLGYGRHSIGYRLTREQHQTKLVFYLFIFANTLLLIAGIISVLYIFIRVTYAVRNLLLLL